MEFSVKQRQKPSLTSMEGSEYRTELNRLLVKNIHKLVGSLVSLLCEGVEGQ